MTLEDIFLRLTSGDAQSIHVSEIHPDGQDKEEIQSGAAKIAGQFFDEDGRQNADAVGDSSEGQTDGGEE